MRDYGKDHEFPPIRRVGEISAHNAAAVDAATDGLSGLLSAGSKAIEGMRHSDADLLIWLTRKLHQAQNAQRRSIWFGGRFYNRMANEDPDYLEMSGVHLAQVLACIGLNAPPWVVAKGTYRLRYDMAARSLAALREDAGRKPVGNRTELP